MQKIMIIDTETTGSNPDIHAIIQIAGMVIIKDEVKTEFDIKVSPFEGAIIDPKAEEAHSIPESELNKPDRLGYPSAKIKLQNLTCVFVNKYAKTDKFWFVAYNAPFDAGMIRSMWTRCHDVYFGSLWWWPVIDVAQMAAIKLGHERRCLPNFKLETVCEYVGIQFNKDEAHDALYDVKKTYELFNWCRV